MHFLIFIFPLVRARPNYNEEYPSYEICKFFQEDKIGEMYKALGLKNQWPHLEKDLKYENQGQVISIGDLDMYVVGDGPNAIIWNYDVYGFDAGMDSRTSLDRPEPRL